MPYNIKYMVRKNQKLIQEDIDRIKSLYKQGIIKAEIARMYKVSRARIGQILELSTKVLDK